MKFLNTNKTNFNTLSNKNFLRPLFLIVVISFLLILLVMMCITQDIAVLSNLGTIYSGKSNQEVEAFKESIVSDLINNFKEEGLTLGNLDLTEEELSNFAGISMVKTLNEDDNEGKNIITLFDSNTNDVKEINFSNNITKNDYYCLDKHNNSRKIAYSYATIGIERRSTRWMKKVSDLQEEYDKDGTLSSLTEKMAGTIINTSNMTVIQNSKGEDTNIENVEIAITNITDSFMVKYSIPTYLYMSTYNKNICNEFVENDIFNSQIVLEEKKGTVVSSGRGGISEEIDFGTIKKNIIIKQEINEETGEIYEYQEEYWDTSVDRKPIYIYDAYKFKSVTILEVKEITGDEIKVIVGVSKKDGEYDAEEEFEENTDLKIEATLKLDFVEMDAAGNKIYKIKGTAGGIKSAYETTCQIETPIYLVKEATTWFGIFEFDNRVNNASISNVKHGVVDCDSVGTTIKTSCKYRVNEDAKEKILEMFKEEDSSLSNLSIFASYIEKNAIENDDYNLKLTYYGLCRMFEDVEGVNIPLNEEIEAEFGETDDLQISTVPHRVYNMFMSAAHIAKGSLENTYSSYVSNSVQEFNEYTMPYGANYRKDFPTKSVNMYMDLNVPSGLTLEEYYKIGQYFATRRWINLSYYNTRELNGHVITQAENLEYCLKLAEACYNIESDVGLNGLYILSAAVFEGGWGASYFSVSQNNLWGFRIFTNTTAEQLQALFESGKTFSRLYPDSINEKYPELHQKCAYQVACYLKIRYLTKKEDFEGYMNELGFDEDNIKLQEIEDTGENYTDEEFYDLLSKIDEEEVRNLLLLYRNWNGSFSSGSIGGFYSEYFGPTVYTIDGKYVRGWRYENKSYGNSGYFNMKSLYNKAIN